MPLQRGEIAAPLALGYKAQNAILVPRTELAGKNKTRVSKILADIGEFVAMGHGECKYLQCVRNP
jgi:hypothetical protein